MEKYKYRPLNQERNEIRLVRFLGLSDATAGRQDARNLALERAFQSRLSLGGNHQIRCAIEHHSLDAVKMQYTALSYNWGPQTQRQRLIIQESEEEKAILITRNLHSALQHLAFGTPVWIDSICINQADDEEKSWQVNFMWKIYESAVIVSAWLGPSADDSDKLMDQIRNTYIAVSQAVSKLPQRDRVAAMKTWSPPEREFVSFSAFATFLQRPYWRRVWIQQELHAQNNVYFHCGTKEASMAAFRFALRKASQIRDQLRGKRLSIVKRESFEARIGYFLSHENTRTLMDILQRHGRGRKRLISFADLMRQIFVHSEGLLASDERDLVFALLGMAGNQVDFSDILKADYTLTKDQAYGIAAIQLISHVGPEILTWSNCHGSPKEEDKLASWAPDWTRRILRPLGDFGERKGFRYNASGGSKFELRLEESADRFPYVVVKGIVVDSVAHVGAAMDYQRPDLFDDTQDPNLALQSGWLEELERLSRHCHCSKHYPTSETLQEALWKTPIADQGFTPAGEHVRASADLEEGYNLVRLAHLRATMKAAKFYGATAAEKEQWRLTARYWRVLVFRSGGRRYFCSSSGLLGLGPDGVREGDVVAVIMGMDTLMVLRRQPDLEEGEISSREAWRIVGEAYAHGVMDGEMMGNPGKEDIREFWIC
jgi:Heterokaryon incompatibility protein (HET)